MDDRLRQELIAYFDHEVGRPPAGIRDRVLHELAEPGVLDRDLRADGRIRLLRQVAGAAAFVVAIAAFAGLLMFTRLHQTTRVPATPHASAAPIATPAAGPTAVPTPAVSPTRVSTAFSAPDSVPAIVFGDPADRTQTDAVAWDGSGLGRLAAAGVPNPAGTLFLTTTSVKDRLGRTVASVAVTGKKPPSWSDDGRMLCRTTPDAGLGMASGTPVSLQVSALGGAWRTVGQYGTAAENSGVDIAACSTLNDRAVLVGRMYQGPGVRQLWVLQLSTGQVLWSRSFPPGDGTVIDVVASHDGASVAVGRATCCPNSGYTTTVYGPSGGQVRVFDGHACCWAATAFSWDGSRMILAAGADGSQVTVVDVQTGTTVWRAPAGLKVAGIVVEPLAGGRLGIALNGTGAFAGPDGYVPAADLYLVDAAGRAKKVETQIRPW
jgi:hypothetical protein